MPADMSGNDSSIGEIHHPPPSLARWRQGPPFRRDGSELGRQVAVDLEADADLDEGRGRPSHWVVSLVLKPCSSVTRIDRLWLFRKHPTNAPQIPAEPLSKM